LHTFNVILYNEEAISV